MEDILVILDGKQILGLYFFFYKVSLSRYSFLLYVLYPNMGGVDPLDLCMNRELFSAILSW